MLVPKVKRWYRFSGPQLCAAALLVVGLVLLVLGSPLAATMFTNWWQGVLVGFSGNLITGALTAFIVDILSQHDSKQNRLRSLILDLLARDPALSKRAVREMKDEGWLHDGTLAGLDLSYVQLEGVDFEEADLIRVGFTGASLKACNLRGAKLSGATLDSATFSKCDLSDADLSGVSARLSDWADSDLRGAILTNAKFCESGFRNTDLTSAQLTGADFTGADTALAKGFALVDPTT